MTDLTPVITLDGDPAQMGGHHGEAAAAVIRELAAERLDVILADLDGVTRDDVRDAAEAVLLASLKLTPEVFEESRATAAAAGISHWELLVAGGFSDIHDACAKRVRGTSALTECTLWPAQMSSGELLLAGTWDTHASAQKALVVIDRRPTRGPRTIALSTAGWPMQQGVSSAGLAFAIANMAGRSSSSGTSYICALPQIVGDAGGSAESASQLAASIPLASARYFTFADSAGRFGAVESLGEGARRSSREVAHTNHFVLEDAPSFEGRPEVVAGSEKRREVAAGLMLREVADPAEVLLALAPGEPASEVIVQKGVEREDRTCAAFVLAPRSQTIVFTAGQPGECPVEVVTM